MKRGKLILAAIASIGIAGGTLAFKTVKHNASNSANIYYTTNAYNAIAPASNVIEGALPEAGSFGRVYWTVVANTQARNYSIILAGL